MDKRLIHLLDSSDVSERERAIKAMARSGDPGYIGYLNALAKTDPDAGLRSLAAKAIQYINQKSGASERPDDEPHGRTTPKRVEVSAANERRAASMLDRAMELSTRHDDEAARELVIKAYQLDPNIRLDGYKRGIVGTVMGMGADQAFDLLDEQVGGSPEKAKRKAKEKNDASSGEDVGWGTALLDLAIYGAVVVLSLIITFFLLVQFGRPTLQQIAQSATVEVTTNGEVTIESVDPETVAFFLNSLIGAGTIIAVGYALVTAIMNVIGVFFVSVFIHFAAKIIGGDGSLPRLINKTVPLYTIGYVVAFIFTIMVTVVTFSDMSTVIEANSTVTNGSVLIVMDEEDLGEMNPTIGLITMVAAVLSLVFFIIFIGRIAAAYDFGWLRGCIAYFLGQIFMTMTACGCAFVMTTVFASMLTSFFNSMVMTSM